MSCGLGPSLMCLNIENLFGYKQRNMPRRQKRQRKSPKKMIHLLLTLKHIRILNLLENLVKHHKEIWPLSEECFQDSPEPRQTVLSLPQVCFSRRGSMEYLIRPNLLHFRMLSRNRNQRNGLKRFNLNFPLWKKPKLGNLACDLVKGRQFPWSEFSRGRLMVKEKFADIR